MRSARIAPTTRRGTSAGGRRNSIGTNTSWVATAQPAPTLKATRSAIAYAATRPRASPEWNGRPAGSRAAMAIATRAKVEAAAIPTARSRVPIRRERRSRASLSTRSSSGSDSGASPPREDILLGLLIGFSEKYLNGQMFDLCLVAARRYGGRPASWLPQRRWTLDTDVVHEGSGAGCL